MMEQVFDEGSNRIEMLISSTPVSIVCDLPVSELSEYPFDLGLSHRGLCFDLISFWCAEVGHLIHIIAATVEKRNQPS